MSLPRLWALFVVPCCDLSFFKVTRVIFKHFSNRAPVLCYVKLYFKAIEVNWNWDYSPETLNSGQNRRSLVPCDLEIWWMTLNKANLRDLIAATGLKLDWNCQFFNLCDLEIWWMTSKNYGAPLLHYIKLCVSSQTPPWIQTGVTVPKRTIRVKIGDFFVPCDIELWRMTLKNNRAPLLHYIKLCASFQTHWWIQT